MAHGDRPSDPGRLVFVDEMGAHASLVPLYAYAPIGERAFFKVPRNRGQNSTLVASLRSGGVGPSMVVKGATTKEVFETYVEHFLTPTLGEGQIIVMDNLEAHRPKRVRQLIEASLHPYFIVICRKSIGMSKSPSFLGGSSTLV
jgi:hypothetical protein